MCKANAGTRSDNLLDDNSVSSLKRIAEKSLLFLRTQSPRLHVVILHIGVSNQKWCAVAGRLSARAVWRVAISGTKPPFIAACTALCFGV
jgi:hypothetical protein